MREHFYFDNNATTRPLPEVVEAMSGLMQSDYANPSSVHQVGQSARHAVERAREQVASLLGANSREILFTAGGTESINLAIIGYLSAHPTHRRIVTTAVEHSATLSVTEHLEEQGFEVVRVGVDRQGRLDEDEWFAALTDETALASLLHANNETGVVWNVAALAAVAADRGIAVHVDAVQSVGKVPIAVHEWPVSLLSCSAHKFHGPKGAGALYVRRRTRLSPVVRGGAQERNLRGGTENVPAIVGMGVASQAIDADQSSVARLRDRLESGLLEASPDAKVIGGGQRVPNTTNIAFRGVAAEALLLLMSEAGIFASSGSACSSGSLEPSHVIKAMGVDADLAQGAIRFSLSRFNTTEEVDHVVAVVPQLVNKLHALSSN